MKKIIIYSAVVLMCSTLSCTKNFTALNTNPAQYSTPDPEPVFTGVVMNTVNELETLNQTYFWEYGHLIEPLSERYNAQDDNNWKVFYATVLGNATQIKNIYQNNPAGYANRLRIVDIWECYVYSILVGMYGPIPYTHAGDPSLTVIPYDDENTVYTDLMARLKADANNMNMSGDKMNPDVLNFTLTNWVKFANSLRLQIALRVSNNLPALSASNAQELMANETMLLGSDADDPKLNFSAISGSQSPNYAQYVVNTNPPQYPYMSDYVFTYFRSYNDPRMGAYFAPSVVPYAIKDTLTSTADNLHHIVTYTIPYFGSPKAPALLSSWSIPTAPLYNGTTATLGKASFSGIQPALIAATRPFYIMTYAEVCFMKAEAANKGYGGTQTADAYYYAGINANFAFWGLTPAQATNYEAQNGIKWNTAGTGFNYYLGATISTSIPNDNMKRIWIQEWMNYFDDNGFEAWCLQRRTQNLVLPPSTNAATIYLTTVGYGTLPDRFAYPNVEITNNPTGYANGVKLLGSTLNVYGDSPFTHLKIEPAYTPINWITATVFLDPTYVEKWFGPTTQSTATGLAAAGLSPYVQTGTY
jgi:hypothetical protein